MTALLSEDFILILVQFSTKLGSRLFAALFVHGNHYVPSPFALSPCELFGLLPVLP